MDVLFASLAAAKVAVSATGPVLTARPASAPPPPSSTAAVTEAAAAAAAAAIAASACSRALFSLFILRTSISLSKSSRNVTNPGVSELEW